MTELPSFAEIVTIWHSDDRLEYVLDRETLIAHTAHLYDAGQSLIRKYTDRQLTATDAIVEVFSLVMTDATGQEVISPTVAIYSLDADQRICRVEAFATAMPSSGTIPGLAELERADPTNAQISESRRLGRITHPGIERCGGDP